MKQNEYTITARLIQQSPVIHFQSRQAGACLRASEVKPKLDRFLRKKCMEEGVEYSDWISDREAFDYKMSIRTAGPRDASSVIKPPALYYGNMGASGTGSECVKGDDQLTIVCFIPELLEFIGKHLEAFFIVTNFGRMNDKGFGCYVLEETLRKKDDEIGRILAEHYGAPACYVVRGYERAAAYPVSYTNRAGQTREKWPIFDDIKTFYSLLKSGINLSRGDDDPRYSYHRSLLFLYCHEKLGMGNEKAFMKKKGVSPNIGVSAGKKGEPYNDEDYKYVRGMLGVGERIRYKTDPFGKDTQTVKISHVPERGGDKIERAGSPIQFVVINDRFYIVAHRIEEGLLYQKYKFFNTNTKESLTVDTPGKEFKIDDFMDYAVKRYNDDVKAIRNDSGIPKFNVWFMSKKRLVKTAYPATEVKR